MGKLTWDEIKEKYPKQWVRIENAKMDPDEITVVSGVVTKHGTMSTQDYIDTYDGKCLTRFVSTGKIAYLGAAV